MELKIHINHRFGIDSERFNLFPAQIFGASPTYADYGGPLACNNRLVGVISQYKHTTRVSTYTRISAYSDWIKANGSSRLGISILVVLMAALAKFIL